MKKACSLTLRVSHCVGLHLAKYYTTLTNCRLGYKTFPVAKTTAHFLKNKTMFLLAKFNTKYIFYDQMIMKNHASLTVPWAELFLSLRSFFSPVYYLRIRSNSLQSGEHYSAAFLRLGCLPSSQINLPFQPSLIFWSWYGDFSSVAHFNASY